MLCYAASCLVSRILTALCLASLDFAKVFMTGAPLYMAASGYLHKLDWDLILIPGYISMGRNGLEHIEINLQKFNHQVFLIFCDIRILQKGVLQGLL